MEDNHLKISEIHDISKTNISEDEENKIPTLQLNKKFVEDLNNDDIHDRGEKLKIKRNIEPKVLKKKKADYIYDFVKIRVHLDNHFYILSRFFISRMLTLCKVLSFG